jgi:hypothetical protein
MFRKMMLLSVTILGICTYDIYSAQVSCTWIGGGWGYWEDAGNWSCGVIPNNNATDTYAVTIDGGTVEITANHTIDSLDTYDTYNKVNLKRWSLNPVVLTLTNSFTNHGELDTPNTTHLRIYGALINAAGAKIDICSEELRVYGQVGIRNFGRIFIDPDAELKSEESDINNFSLLEMRGGGASAEVNFRNDTGGIIEGYGVVSGHQILNAGLIKSIGGTLQLFGDIVSNTGTLKNNPGATIRTRTDSSNQSNHGLIEVYSGGAVVFDCNLINEPNGVINLIGGTLGATKITQKADANFTGFGGITGNVQIEPNAVVKFTGPTNVVGDVNIPADATLEISDGQTLITGQTTCDGTVHLVGGTVIFQGGCDCNDCNIINEAGLDRNHFDLNADGEVDLEDFDYFADTWLWHASWY